MKKGLIIILMFFSGFTYSQDAQKVDSIKNIIQSAIHDSIRVNAIMEWDNLIYRSDPSLDLKLIQRVANISSSNLKLKNKSKKEIRFFKSRIAWAHNSLGIIYMDRGDYDSAKFYFDKSLNVKSAIGDKNGVANANANIGLMYNKKADMKRCLVYYLKALKLYEEIKNENGIAIIYNNIGMLHHYQNNYPEALKTLLKSLKLRKKIGDQMALSDSYNNIGVVYYEQLKYDSAYKYFTMAMEIRTRMNDLAGMAETSNNIGILFKEKKNYKEALQFHSKAVELRLQIGDQYGLSSSYANLGNIYLKLKEMNKSQEYYKKSLALSLKIEAKQSIIFCYEGLSKLDSAAGNFKNAYENYKLAIRYRDSIMGEENKQQTLRLQMQYDFDKKSAADSIINARQNIIKEAELARHKAEIMVKRNQQYFMFGGLALVFIFAGFIYNRFRITQRQKLIIEEQKYLVEHQKKEVEEKNKDITDSINYAKRIQLSFLPRPEELDKILGKQNYFVFYNPKDIVSGDFYWAAALRTTSKTEESHPVVVFATGDCTGHGVPGSMMTMIGNTLLNQTLKNEDVNSPADALHFLNVELPKNLKGQSGKTAIRDGMDLVMIAIDRSNQKLYFAGANNSLYIVRNNEIIEYKGDSQAITASDEGLKEKFNDHRIDILEGDMIYMTTDGYPDQFGGPKGKKFMYKQFEKLLLEISNLSMKEQHEILKNRFDEWKGNLEQVDDVTVIGIRI